ncbi:sulfhydryl oxidase 1-like isoform X1 [Canna indica]|uniref:Sulfhydryl oxidase n=1 Tax=Canna indica TaxID=4628 RepID=A0AAQ3KZI5_9LILI|nr:sulfhydryl oxidase 1-like isoform X1 [Canna indica]
MPDPGRTRLLLIVALFLLPGLDALRTLVDSGDIRDAAVELNASNFESFLKESPLKFAVVEFFASWCPACRNYKPQYEKVARLFNGPDAVHPGIVLLARVDCAMKVNTDLCSRFSVSRYPMLFWGPPRKFSDGRWDPKKNKDEIQEVDEWRTPDLLLNYINKRIGSSFSLSDDKYENENTLPMNASDPEEISRAIYDIEESTAQAFQIIFQNKMIKSNTRSELIKFLQLLVAHHPSKRCRKGSAEMLVNFDDLWPSNHLSVSSQDTIVEEVDASRYYHICGKEIPRGYWIFCRGSKEDTRGYSCGLWVLFHSLSVRIEDGESNLTFTAICDFIQNFFTCDECRQHFHEMSSGVSVPFNKTRDLAMWLWHAHNKVNQRLMVKEKELGTGDPRFPKIMWPPKQLCPSCYLSSSRDSNGLEKIKWDENEVFKFLVRHYGKTISSSKEATLSSNEDDASSTYGISSSSNAIVVPVGAALAIAIASCAFGALACFWRTQQKNRKYLHKLHSLKNI